MSDLIDHTKLAAQREALSLQLPWVLWRVVTSMPGRVPDGPTVAWFEVEGVAVSHIEDELYEGAGLVSVHRLDLYLPTPDDRRTTATWRELKYLPPARGRLVAPSPPRV